MASTISNLRIINETPAADEYAVVVRPIGGAAGLTDVNIIEVGGNPVTDSVPVNTKTDLTPAAPTFVTVGLVSALAVAANADRKGLILVNTSVNRISLGFGAPAVLDSGVTLYPAGSFNMAEYDFDLGDVNAIASAASSNLAIQEYTT